MQEGRENHPFLDRNVVIKNLDIRLAMRACNFVFAKDGGIIRSTPGRG